MKPLRITLLGGFEVYSAKGQPLALPTRKAKGLLAYLAMSGGRAQARDKLTALLWEQSGAARARASLRQTLSRLRKLLNVENAETLLIEGDSILLNPTAVEVDAVRFECLVSDGTPEALEEASALYHGSFLEGLGLLADPFEEWLMAERMRLHELLENGLRKLLAHYRDVHATEDAIRVAGRLLNFDPLQESVYRLLMQLYIESGRPRSALKQYELCREMLQRELGVEPEADTRQIAEQLRARQPASLSMGSTPLPFARAAQAHGGQFFGAPDKQELKAIDVPLYEQAAPTFKIERRFLNLMLCELVNAAALSTRLDPEDLREVIAAFEDCCEDIVNRLGGHIARYMGHSMSVYFGYPQADEHDAERAIRAALQIVKAVGELSLPFGLKLQTRISIASGNVVVGKRIRDTGVQEETIAGDTPYLVAALQTVAAPDSVLVADSTKALVGAQFEYQDLGTRLLEGFDAEVRIWRVARERPAQDRFEVMRETRKLTQLVGREEEMELLMRRWQRAKLGAGQVVLLAGEPGIGKSRLTVAMREMLAGEAHKPLSFHCSPYHRDTALFAVINQLERAAGLTHDDEPSVKLDKLESLFAKVTDDLSDAVPLVAALLSIATDQRYPVLNLTPQRQKAKTLKFLEEQLTGLAKKQPLLVIFEALHWSDPTTLEFVGRLVELIQALPVLMIVTHRPDMSIPWIGEPHVTSLVLRRFNPGESKTLVEQLTAQKSLPRELLEQVVSKANGVPLFIEELTRNVLEAGILEDQGDCYTLKQPLATIGIPDTLYDLLLARLDRLGPAKSVAQQAAVIGRRFCYGLLSAVSALSESELQAALTKLIEAELLYVRGTFPHATYSFKHTLVQEAAYSSLLRAEREAQHARIVTALGEQFPEIPETEPEVLAHHCAGAGFKEEAILYWRRAGERAVQHSSNMEAIAYFSKALALLKTSPQTPQSKEQELRLQVLLGRAWILAEGYAAREVEAAYTRARDLCEEVGDTHQLFLVLLGLWQMYISRQALELANNTGARLLPLALAEKDSDFALEAHIAQSITFHAQGAFSSALIHANEAIELHDPTEHQGHALRFGQDAGVIGRIMASWSLWCLGYADQALIRMQEALAMARNLNHPYSEAMALYCSAWLHQYRCEAKAASEHAAQAIALSNEHGFAWPLAFATMLHGWTLAAEGQTTAVIVQIRGGLATLEKMGVRLWRPHMQAMLAAAYAAVGRGDEALTLLTEALDTAGQTGEEEYAAELYRLKGELTLQHATPKATAEAEACFDHALGIARRQQAKSWELRAATSLAGLWHGQGKHKQACELLTRVYRWFTEGFDTPDLQDAQALLDRLASARGDGRAV